MKNSEIIKDCRKLAKSQSIKFKRSKTINKINDALEVRRKKRVTADWEAGHSGATEFYPQYAKKEK